uniref:Connective tissue growth factor n=1 Tax=Cacopsylla melanoneura TaxID=428564 RepID=A0A8D8TRE0_9HEMI
MLWVMLLATLGILLISVYTHESAQVHHNQFLQTGHCSYPCECESQECAEGVITIRDGCGCCEMCARQIGEPCDSVAVCDESKDLVCQYSAPFTTGTCQAQRGVPCYVHNVTYGDGETFMLDCRTQCTCENGTYACSSLCPQERILPRGSSCHHPRLVEVPGQCCREWMCDSESVENPPLSCQPKFTPWSSCSTPCGVGMSYRQSLCSHSNQTRLCQLRPCFSNFYNLPLQSPYHHHIRKGHECKATRKSSKPVFLRFKKCRSKKKMRPRFCGQCRGQCCVPHSTTTLKVEFLCREKINLESMVIYDYEKELWSEDEDDFEDDSELESEHTNIILSVEWITKCKCSKFCDGAHL